MPTDRSHQPGRGQLVSFGVIAQGRVAIGVIAMGGVSIGLVALGGVAVGVVALGGVTLGALAVGAVALGWSATGGLAFGIAHSQGAWMALGLATLVLGGVLSRAAPRGEPLPGTKRGGPTETPTSGSPADVLE